MSTVGTVRRKVVPVLPTTEGLAETARPMWKRGQVLAAVVVVAVVGLAEGWLYSQSYYGSLGVPTNDLGISPTDMVVQGARCLLPLTGAGVGYLLAQAGWDQRPVAVGVVLYAGLIAYLAYVERLLTGPEIAVQSASVLVAGTIALGRSHGFGRTATQGLALVAGLLLVLVLLPVVYGGQDAVSFEGTSKTDLRIVSSRDLGIPDATSDGSSYVYSDYLLVRETDSRYWILRVAHPQSVYAISRSDVVSVRY